MTSLFKRLPPAEWALYGAFAALAALACWGPYVAQSAHHHAFAEQRTLWGIPHALDVLTNLPFAVAGLAGLWALARHARTAPGAARGTMLAMAGLFFAGLLLTAAGSSLYHWQPHDATLLWDRAGMLAAFAGVLGLGVAGRIGTRPAWAAALAVLAGGGLALRAWGMTGQILPWAVLQGGGMLLVVALAALPTLPGRLHVPLAAVIGWYALAKLLELGDHAVWGWTGEAVSGHSLKHVAAALAAWPVIGALRGTPGRYLALCVRGTPWRRRGTGTGEGTMAAHSTQTPSHGSMS